MGVFALFGSRPVLVGGEERGHVCERVLVGVARPVELAARIVDGAVALLLLRFCTVPHFTDEESAAVHTCEEGFESAHVFDCCRVAAADFAVPFVVYEAGAGAAHADGDGHVIEVADVFGEVVALLVRERVPRVGERLHDGEVCRVGGEARCGFGDLVGLGGVHGCVSFSLVVGVFSCLALLLV